MSEYGFEYFAVVCPECGIVKKFSIALLGWDKAELKAIKANRKHADESTPHIEGENPIERLSRIHFSVARPIEK